MQPSLFPHLTSTPDGQDSRADSGAHGASLDLRQELNDAQYEAATTIDGPILVVAGAGAVVCTAKDLVKIGLEQLGSLPLRALTIGMEFLEGQQQLEAQLAELAQTVAADDTID